MMKIPTDQHYFTCHLFFSFFNAYLSKFFLIMIKEPIRLLIV
jgi:hypothetical protein